MGFFKFCWRIRLSIRSAVQSQRQHRSYQTELDHTDGMCSDLKHSERAMGRNGLVGNLEDVQSTTKIAQLEFCEIHEKREQKMWCASKNRSYLTTGQEKWLSKTHLYDLTDSLTMCIRADNCSSNLTFMREHVKLSLKFVNLLVFSSAHFMLDVYAQAMFQKQNRWNRSTVFPCSSKSS